jgi:hypothetical protein
VSRVSEVSEIHSGFYRLSLVEIMFIPILDWLEPALGRKAVRDRDLRCGVPGFRVVRWTAVFRVWVLPSRMVGGGERKKRSRVFHGITDPSSAVFGICLQGGGEGGEVHDRKVERLVGDEA